MPAVGGVFVAITSSSPRGTVRLHQSPAVVILEGSFWEYRWPRAPPRIDTNYTTLVDPARQMPAGASVVLYSLTCDLQYSPYQPSHFEISEVKALGASLATA